MILIHKHGHTHTLPQRKPFKIAKLHWAPVMCKAQFCLPPTGRLTEGKTAICLWSSNIPSPREQSHLLANSFSWPQLETQRK